MNTNNTPSKPRSHRSLGSVARRLFGAAALTTTLAAGLAMTTAPAAADPPRNVGQINGEAFYAGVLNGDQDQYWVHVRNSSKLRVNVRDDGGRGIDYAAIRDAQGRTLSESRNRIGAQLGADNVRTGWYRIVVSSSKRNHGYGLNISARAQNERPDVGNGFDRAHDLGSVGGSRYRSYWNYVAPSDEDYYRFTLPFASNQLELALPGAGRDQVYVEVYRLNGSRADFVSRASAKGQDSPVLVDQLQQGTYFARVTSSQVSEGPYGGYYLIHLRNTAVNHDPGGSFEQPGRMQLTRGPVHEQVTNQVDAMDVWQFDVPNTPNNSYQVSFALSADRGEYSLSLLRGGGSSAFDSLANDTSTSRNRTLTRGLAGGQYRLMVLAKGDRTPTHYRIDITVPRPSTGGGGGGGANPLACLTTTDASNSPITPCNVPVHPSASTATPQISQSVGGSDFVDWFTMNIGCNIPSRRPVLQIDRSSAAVNVTLQDQAGTPIPVTPSGNTFYFTLDRNVTPHMAITSASGLPASYSVTVRRFGCQ